MGNSRRNFVKTLPFAVLIPQQVLSNIVNENANALKSKSLYENIDKIYDDAIVFDGIVITRNWNEVADKALAKSGYTGFNASLNSGSLNKALASLSEWHIRIKDNPDKFITATSANDFIQAKKDGKVAVMMGFQNTTPLEKSIDNLDILYQAGTRWMQLTYNHRNLVGDGCTERTNAGLSDYGIEVVERMNELGIIVDLSHCG